jgi:signal transduction histidine kinase
MVSIREINSQNPKGTRLKMPMLVGETYEAEQSQQLLLEVQRLAGIGTLTAGVAHELTNPINVITATCNNLLSQMADGSLSTDELLHYVEMIDQSAWRCVRLIRTLRDYTYLNGQTYSPRDLNLIVEAALILVSYEFERQYNLDIVTNLEPELEPLVCDQNQIVQVLINFLTNARDAMLSQGGRVVVSTWSMPEEDAQAFSVSDTGLGIDPAVLPRIFEPFVTTKPMGSGTGLGLSIAAQIVDEHHGRIMAENNPEGGATFTVILPCKRHE